MSEDNTKKPQKIATVGSRCTHGAIVITGEKIRTVNGKQVARLGDLVNCPEHGVNKIVSTLSGPLDTTQKKTAFVGSRTECGAVIITGEDLTKVIR